MTVHETWVKQATGFLGKEFVVFDYVPVWGSGKFLIASTFSTTVDGIFAKCILPYRSYSKAYFLF